MYDLIWSIFFEKLSLVIKNAPFILETVKHLIKLSLGEAPGYVPVVGEDQFPSSELTDIFLNIYRIRYYHPAFMEIGYFNREPVYYSMQKHTFFCNVPQKTNASRTIDELVTIKDLILSFKEHVLENKFPFSLENTILYKTLQEVEFDFYHPQGSASLSTDIQGMIAEDPRFSAQIQTMDYDKTLGFPHSSLFFNGCIRIRASKKILKPSMKDLLDPRRMGHFRLDDKN